MITLKTYQQEAVEGLVKDTFKLLKAPGARQKMVLKHQQVPENSYNGCLLKSPVRRIAG
jgi:hypothetical protein